MRILHILPSKKLSGAENVVADICMMFNGEYEMAYCSPDGPIRDSLKDRNVNYLPLKKMTLSEIKYTVKLFNPDIIHAHDVRSTVLSAIAASGVPFISHLHVNKGDMSKVTLKSILYLLAAKKSEKVIAVSESCINDYVFKKHINEKSIFLQNVIFSPRIEMLIEKDTQDYNFDFVFLGRLSDQKNPEKVARVASKVLQKLPSATFGIIGEGELREEMEGIFQSEGVSSRVTFTGRLAYPYKALKQSKCMLMCSRFEGTPIAALEAMALGVPIISTPVDGMKDLVNDMETGFLYSEDNDLTEAVLKILLDSKLQKEMSSKSIEKFRILNKEKSYKDQLRSIYNNFGNA